jgi:hypothetical protein
MHTANSRYFHNASYLHYVLGGSLNGKVSPIPKVLHMPQSYLCTKEMNYILRLIMDIGIKLKLIEHWLDDANTIGTIPKGLKSKVSAKDLNKIQDEMGLIEMPPGTLAYDKVLVYHEK